MSTSAFYVAPMVILANKYLIAYSNLSGYVSTTCYEIAIHTHFITSLNRFSAVFFPIAYKRVFSIESTRIYVTIAIIVSITLMTVVHFILNCQMEYIPEKSVMFYDMTHPVCKWYVMYGDLLKNVLLIIFDFTIDMVTVLKVHKMRKHLRSPQDGSAKKETDFLKQTIGQSICYLTGYASYLILPKGNMNKYVSFYMSVMSWSFLAMLHGLLTVVFNSEIRTRIVRKKPKIKSSVIRN